MTMVLATHVDGVNHIGRHVGSVGKQTTSKWCAGAAIVTKIEQETTCNNQMDIVSITSISSKRKQLVIVEKLKTSSSQNSTKYLINLTWAVIKIFNVNRHIHDFIS